jgi:hypothetical protein
VSYQPQFTITPALLTRVEQIAALRERIQAATVEVPWIPALQKDTRTRNTHSSTAIEGNPRGGGRSGNSRRGRSRQA